MLNREREHLHSWYAVECDARYNLVNLFQIDHIRHSIARLWWWNIRYLLWFSTDSYSNWFYISWWRHQMETFSPLLALCAGNSLVTGEFPSQRPVTQSFDVFIDLRLNKRLSKQSWGWWFETLLRPLLCQCNVPTDSFSLLVTAALITNPKPS